MTTHLPQAAAALFRWLSGTTTDGQQLDAPADLDAADHGEGSHEFGVHVDYTDLYDAIIFLTCAYVAGKVASRLLRMPPLVGEIVAGILLGPNLSNFVPNPSAWVLLGEIGCVLWLLCEVLADVWGNSLL